MTTNMLSAARLIAHKTVNGRYQSKLQMDQFPVLGHSMTVSQPRLSGHRVLDMLLTVCSIPSTLISQTAPIRRLPCIAATSQRSMPWALIGTLRPTHLTTPNSRALRRFSVACTMGELVRTSRSNVKFDVTDDV